MQNIISKPGQWLGDIAVREAGSLEAIFDISFSQDISITDDLPVGTVIEAVSPINKRVMNYYSINQIYPATAITKEIEETPGGIGYMIIEKTFIVS